MNIALGIMMILVSIFLGIQAKRDMYREINRWTILEVGASVCGFVCGVGILFGVIEIPSFFS